jgi:hypothetical protein
MAPVILYWIIQRLSLTQWRSFESFSPISTDQPGLRMQAIQAQDHMGWLAFFKGCIAIEWAGIVSFGSGREILERDGQPLSS